MAKNAICGKELDTRTSLTAERDNQTLCSAICRATFAIGIQAEKLGALAPSRHGGTSSVCHNHPAVVHLGIYSHARRFEKLLHRPRLRNTPARCTLKSGIRSGGGQTLSSNEVTHRRGSLRWRVFGHWE